MSAHETPFAAADTVYGFPWYARADAMSFNEEPVADARAVLGITSTRRTNTALRNTDCMSSGSASAHVPLSLDRGTGLADADLAGELERDGVLGAAGGDDDGLRRRCPANDLDHGAREQPEPAEVAQERGVVRDSADGGALPLACWVEEPDLVCEPRRETLGPVRPGETWVAAVNTTN